MKKRILAILVAVAMVVCSLASLSFAAETKSAKFTFSADTPVVKPVQAGDKYTLDLVDGDVTLHIEDSNSIRWSDDSYLTIGGVDNLTKITVSEGKKITGVYFSLGQNYNNYYGLQRYYKKNATTGDIYDLYSNDFTTKANGTEVVLDLDEAQNIEYYIPADTDKVTEFTACSPDGVGSFRCTYLTGVTVTYEDVVTPAPEDTKTAGANTGDSNDIALFGIMGIIALCGAGFVYKRRED